MPALNAARLVEQELLLDGDPQHNLATFVTTWMEPEAQQNAQALADELAELGYFELIGPDEEQLPLVAFKLAEERGYDEFDIAWRLSAERGWMVPAYTCPPTRSR